MKAKKAVKRLARVETLLITVIDKFPGTQRRVQSLLELAKESVVRAKESMTLYASRAAKKLPGKAGASQRRLTQKGRKSLSLAAKKRWAIAKRKGVHAVTGRPLRRTA